MKVSASVVSAFLWQSTSLVHATGGVRGSTTTETSLLSHPGRALRPLDEVCLAAVGIVDYDDGTPDVTFLDCETPAGLHYKVPVTEEWIKDKMMKGLLKSGETELEMPGAVVDMGKGVIVLPENATPNLINLPNRRERDLRELAVTGSRSVLVVRVIASDGQTGFSEAQLSNSVFGTSGDPVNLKSHYAACSHGRLNFQTTSDRTKTGGGVDATNISLGATTVNVAVSTTEGDGVMRNAISSALNAQFGVSSPSVLANHVMYCLPPNTMSGIAYAYINSWNSVYSNQWCTYVSGQMHEVRPQEKKTK